MLACRCPKYDAAVPRCAALCHTLQCGTSGQDFKALRPRFGLEKFVQLSPLLLLFWLLKKRVGIEPLNCSVVLGTAQRPGKQDFHLWGSIPHETALGPHGVEPAPLSEAQSVVLKLGGPCLIEPDADRDRRFKVSEAVRPILDEPHKVTGHHPH